MRRFVALVALAAVTAVAAPLPVAGAVGISPTAKFTRAANGACAKANKRVARLPEVDKKNVAHVLATEAGILASLTKRLRKVEAPAARKAKFASFVRAATEQTTLIRRALKAAKRKKQKEGEVSGLLSDVVAAGDRARKLADQLGLDVCARDYTPGIG